MIQNKTNCKHYFHKLPQLQAIIDKYMICTLTAGNIDDDGELIFTQKPDADGCSDEDKIAGMVSTTNSHSTINFQCGWSFLYRFEDEKRSYTKNA